MKRFITKEKLSNIQNLTLFLNYFTIDKSDIYIVNSEFNKNTNVELTNLLNELGEINLRREAIKEQIHKLLGYCTDQS